MKAFKFASTLVAMLTVGLMLTHSEPVRVGHVEGEALITLDHEETADLSGGDTAYKDSTTFLSPEYEAPYEFELLGLNWQEDIPEETQAHMEIRFRTDGEWGTWRHLHVDQDAPEHTTELWTYVLTPGSNAFQYRVELSTENASLTPRLSNVSFDYIDGGKQAPLDGLSKLIFKDDSEVITRDEWGANESYRYTDEEPEEDEEEEEEPEYEDMEVGEIVTKEKGNYLKWPYAYPENGVQKIVVHHTASEDLEDVDDFSATVRAIYQYHALSRGWSDIGYNYLIDPEGNIYEGRAGGDGVVAGHAAGYNTGSVGIALIGNFEEEALPGEMLQSLTDVVYEQALLHDINPDGRSRFRGEMMDNILGHRDVGATACPGEHTYEHLEAVREVVAASIDAEASSSGKEYAFEESTDRELVLLDPEDSSGTVIRLKNTGTKTWSDDNTCLVLDPVNDADDIVDHDTDDDCVATMKQSSVGTGKTATFSFIGESNLDSGLAQFKVTPKFNGKLSDQYMVQAYYVEIPVLDFDLKGSDYDKSLEAGESTTVEITLKNTGNVTWRNDGDHPVTLQRSGQSKLTYDRTLAELREDSVKPGQTGTFEFEVEAPNDDGKHSLYFTLDMEDTEVISSTSSRIRITVSGEDEESSASIIDRSDEVIYEPGETRMEWIQIENQGSDTWMRSGDDAFSLSVSADKDVEVGDPKLLMPSVKPNFNTKVFFKVTAPDEPGTYEIDLRPRLGSQNLTTSAYTFEITVGGEGATDDDSEPIRILLTPEDEMSNVLVTSNEDFKLYSGDELVQRFDSSRLLRIMPSGDAFKVSSGSYLETVEGPIRITGGIIELTNFEQRPGWNTSLNDNRFRGTIEIQEIDDELSIINELPLEDYLKGIGEVSDSTHVEKMKTILVLARSYASYYMTQDEKFPGMPYHLDDSPERSQKYLGYGYELRSPNVSEAVEETAGQVVTYDGEVIKTPYFSQSDGVATKNAEDVWGWTHTPYLVSVPDTYCSGDVFLGHGVGLSGCGAEGMAQAGFGYEEIIEYYYTGAELSQL